MSSMAYRLTVASIIWQILLAALPSCRSCSFGLWPPSGAGHLDMVGTQRNVGSRTRCWRLHVDQENEVLFLQIWLPIILSLCAFVCFSGPSHPSYRDFSKYSSLTLELAIVGRECDPKSLITASCKNQRFCAKKRENHHFLARITIKSMTTPNFTKSRPIYKVSGSN
jgi:hypothetical protein